MTNRSERLPRRLGTYELTERIGEGGMGIVYRAVDKRLGTAAAIKVIHDHLKAEPGYLERFRREAHVASLLTSPYIVQVIEFGFDKGVYYLATEFVEGTRLSDVMARGRMEPEQALSVAVQVCLALAEADIRGVIHRDIKPENIIITPDKAVKLMDFGIARLSYARGVTQPGLFVGTVAYAAPEQFRGQADIRTDIYSLGVVLFQMLAGELPFRADTIGEMIHLHEQTPPPLAKLAGLPQPIIDVVARCLEKGPSARFQRPSELLTAIENARDALPATRPSDDWVMNATQAIEYTPEPSQVRPEPGQPAREPLNRTMIDPDRPRNASRPAGHPLASSSTGAERPGGKPPMALFAGLAGGAVLVVALAFFLLGGGGDEDGSAAFGLSPTPNATDLPGVAPTSQGAVATATVPAPTPVPPAAVAPAGGTYAVFGFSDSATSSSDPPVMTVASNSSLTSCNPSALYAWIDYANIQVPSTFTGRWLRDGAPINETSFSQSVPSGRMFWSIGAPLPPATYGFQVLQGGVQVTSGTVTLTC